MDKSGVTRVSARAECKKVSEARRTGRGEADGRCEPRRLRAARPQRTPHAGGHRVGEAQRERKEDHLRYKCTSVQVRKSGAR